MSNPESICPALSPLAEALRVQVAEYRKTLAQFEVEGTKELAEKLAGIKTEIELTEKNINEVLSPFGHSLDTPPLTPKDVNRLLREVDSVAELDPTFEGGIIHVDIDPKIVDALKRRGAAYKAFREADSTRWHIGGSLNDYPWQPLTETSLDVLVMNHGKTTPEEFDTFVHSMDTMGYRPLTLAELMAVVIMKPEYNKRGEWLGTYEKHMLDGSVWWPCAAWNGSQRVLETFPVDEGWVKHVRSLFVRK
jgi:hypothetical protein